MLGNLKHSKLVGENCLNSGGQSFTENVNWQQWFSYAGQPGTGGWTCIGRWHQETATLCLLCLRGGDVLGSAVYAYWEQTCQCKVSTDQKFPFLVNENKKKKGISFLIFKYTPYTGRQLWDMRLPLYWVAVVDPWWLQAVWMAVPMVLWLCAIGTVTPL